MPSLIKKSIRMAAIKLRKQGKTYSQIRSQLKISKGTLSYWSKKITLTPVAQEKLKKTQNEHLKRARIAALTANQLRQTKFIDNIRQNLKSLIDRSIEPDILKIALAFLYLGEGAKWKTHRGLQLGSSDPLIVGSYIKLLEKCYRIDRDQLRCYICYRADQSLDGLIKYWVNVLGIPRSSFYKSSFDKRTIGKPTKNKDYKGVCVVSCAGTKIQQELDVITKMIFEGL